MKFLAPRGAALFKNRSDQTMLSCSENKHLLIFLFFRQSMQISMDVLVDHHIGLFEHVRFGYWALSATGMVGRFPRIHQFVLCCTFHLWDVSEDVQSWLSSKLMNGEFFRPLWAVEDKKTKKSAKTIGKYVNSLWSFWLRL